MAMAVCTPQREHLPMDFFYAVLAHADVQTLMAARQIAQLTACAEFELRRRVVTVQAALDFGTADALTAYLHTIAPIVTHVNFDFNTNTHYHVYDVPTVKSVFRFISDSKTLTDVSLLTLPEWFMCCPPGIREAFACDLSRIRSLRVSACFYALSVARESSLIDLLKTCKVGVLTALSLIKCVKTGASLAAIPGQLHTLQLHECDTFAFEWRHLVDYVRAYPKLRALSIVQPIGSDTLDLRELCPHLLSVRTLRLSSNDGLILSNYAALGQLVDLQRLDVSGAGQEFSALVCRLTPQHQLVRLRLQLTDFRFTEHNAAYLQCLAKLRTLDVCIGHNVQGVAHLVRALCAMGGLRRFGLYAGTEHGNDVPMPPEVTAVLVQQNLRQVDHLRIELPSVKLCKLSRMPRLRTLQLCISNRWSTSARSHRKRTDDTNRLLRELCRTNRLRRLRLESRGEPVHVDAEMVTAEFGRFSRLHRFEVAMSQLELEQFRAASALVPVSLLEVPERHKEECWD